MSEHIILALICGAAATYFFYRRSQQPHRLTEVYNGFKSKSELEAARGYEQEAKAFGDMASAIQHAENIVLTGRLPPASELSAVHMNLLRASGELRSIGIIEQNHHHECYAAIGRLCRRVEELSSLQRDKPF